ncbi:MAG: DUF308 domain-containing protein [Prevotella sp.]|nr:DUF308 domain-containing protein [Prevotella sp.]MBQ8714224.1 DUF308 domain-containing protein [Prevotella sp.]
MKLLQSSIFRALCSIAIGILLLKYPDNSVTWLTMAIGILFLLSGIIALISYWNARRHAGEYTITDAEGNIISGSQPAFPLVGIGSVILGLTLVLSPDMFVQWLMYILGAMLILGSINQLIVLVVARRYGSIGAFFWIAPILIFIAGIVIFVKPMKSAELPMIILGWCMLLYGVTETINSLMVYSLRRKMEQQQKEAANGLEAEEIVTEEKEKLPQKPVEEIVEEVSQSDIIVEEE